MKKKLWRDSVHTLTPYVPGKPIEDVQRELGLDKVIRLASNENPFGPSPKALSAMADAVKDSWLYPEPTCRELRQKLAEKYGLTEGQFLVGNGADHIITLIGNAYINAGDEVIYCEPTFSSYEAITRLMDGVPMPVYSKSNYETDLDAILKVVTNRTKLIFICNPNNPTGTVVDTKDLIAFFKKLPNHVIVVLDEAYVEYMNDSYQTGVDFIKAEYPVIAIRTFSKYYGLAGARVGYAIAKEERLEPMQAVKQTFAVNRIAIAGAVASLEDEVYGKGVLSETKKEMQRLKSGLESLGYGVTDSQANFLFVDFKTDITDLFKKLMHKGILIRPCSAWSLNTHARVTIGTAEQNTKLLTALSQINQLEVKTC
ncbi:histidinol-phosphate transaminase [Siminovitchia acidinfaciens]|uniref:Histidinol-phosphate aminotransferase n=1 Tax=Siminovitchia acidinfaciens TaxID=2321395 RepID=A0A429Y741_9BACI|nr:histidinol-phosphate transaminase [Siminovitchia acidinfaciens]RST77134.1 histidinol-phosphate transaminase [Siminovitchia acidinfaciens]